DLAAVLLRDAGLLAPLLEAHDAVLVGIDQLGDERAPLRERDRLLGLDVGNVLQAHGSPPYADRRPNFGRSIFCTVPSMIACRYASHFEIASRFSGQYSCLS